MGRQRIISLTAFVMMMSLYSCAVRRSEPMTGKVVNTSNNHVKNGQVLYHAYCQKCHPAGEAGLGPSVTSKPGFAKKFQIKHGMGVMPAFKKDQLSRQDVKDIAAYLKALNRVKKRGTVSAGV